MLLLYFKNDLEDAQAFVCPVKSLRKSLLLFISCFPLCKADKYLVSPIIKLRKGQARPPWGNPSVQIRSYLEETI